MRVIPIESCPECILFHCNGDLPENEQHADDILTGFEEVHGEFGVTFSANNLDDECEWYGRRCEICFAEGTTTSPTALVILVNR